MPQRQCTTPCQAKPGIAELGNRGDTLICVVTFLRTVVPEKMMRQEKQATQIRLSPGSPGFPLTRTRVQGAITTNPKTRDFVVLFEDK